MSRLADKVRELAAAASPGSWRFDYISGRPWRVRGPVAKDIATFAWRGNDGDQANAKLTASFGSPDRALAAVEALEAASEILHDLIDPDSEAVARQVRSVRRSWEQALGIAEEQSDGRELAERLRKPPDLREPRDWQRAMYLLAEAVELLATEWDGDWDHRLTALLRRVAEATEGGEAHER